ncbi:hypothetical protein ACXIZN_04890 [Amycolatopsis sp. TRM77291]
MKRAVVVAAVGAASMGIFGGTAVAEPEATWHKSGASWNDPNDKGGVSSYEKAAKTSGNEMVMGQFIAYDEKLTLWDEHNNGRKAILKLWVGGSGPAVFYSHGDGTTRVIDESYDEGQTVYLQVCTSDSPNAVCTKRQAKGVS